LCFVFETLFESISHSCTVIGLKPALIRSNRPTHPTHTHKHTRTPTHPQTNRQDRLRYTAPQLARSVMKGRRCILCIWVIR